MLICYVVNEGRKSRKENMCSVFTRAMDEVQRYNDLTASSLVRYRQGSGNVSSQIVCIVPSFGRSANLNASFYNMRDVFNGLLSARVVYVLLGTNPAIIDSVPAHFDALFLPYLGTHVHIPKSLCYNLAFLLAPPSPYYLFHDVDVIVNRDFVQGLEDGLKSKVPWMQPYYGKSVPYLSKRSSKLVRKGLIDGRSIVMNNIELEHPTQCCSPGGSILISAGVFCSVGGYDADIFVGYSPEDRFIWFKLELIGGPYYTNNSRARAWHLHHERNIWRQNPLFAGNYKAILKTYVECSRQRQLEIVRNRAEGLMSEARTRGICRNSDTNDMFDIVRSRYINGRTGIL